MIQLHHILSEIIYLIRLSWTFHRDASWSAWKDRKLRLHLVHINMTLTVFVSSYKPGDLQTETDCHGGTQCGMF